VYPIVRVQNVHRLRELANENPSLASLMSAHAPALHHGGYHDSYDFRCGLFVRRMYHRFDLLARKPVAWSAATVSAQVLVRERPPGCAQGVVNDVVGWKVRAWSKRNSC